MKIVAVLTLFSLVFSLAIIVPSPFAFAQDAPKLGRETNLPIPRYISINSTEANMRHGPSQDYPIDWLYHRKGLPVRVIGESGHWRKVEDSEGTKGWFHYALLSGQRTVLITAERVSVSKAPGQTDSLTAILENGVIAKLEACVPNWCKIEINGYEGWLPKNVLWGVDAGEVFE